MARKKQHQEEHTDETWLIPYSDMLTLLLALFVVLFAMSQIDQVKFQQMRRALDTVFSGGSGIMPDNTTLIDIETGQTSQAEVGTPNDFMTEDLTLHKYKVMLDNYFKEEGLDHVITNIVTEQGLKITIQEVASFDSGRANLRPEFLSVLKNIATVLQELNNNIQVSGHTDDRPIHTAEFPSNWELSVGRSMNVMKYMVNNSTIKPERFTIVGNGEYRPITTNTTEEGRAANRRVELLVTRMYPK